MTDIMLVGPTNMLVGHEGRPWGQVEDESSKILRVCIAFGCNPQTHQS